MTRRWGAAVAGILLVTGVLLAQASGDGKYHAAGITKVGEIPYPVNTAITGMVILEVSLSPAGAAQNVQTAVDKPPLTEAAATVLREDCSRRNQMRRGKLGTAGRNKKRREARATRPVIQRNGLERLNVGSLQALGAADNLEFNGLSLVEGAIAVRLNGGEMDENVLASLALDETKTLAGVKPLHCSLFFH
jgi:hypothetical protein